MSMRLKETAKTTEVPELFRVHREKTARGLRLLVVPMKATSTVTLMVCVGTGSRHEVPEESGISHFLEHIFFKGSKKRPTTQMIAETMDGIGGEFNASTSKEMTAFYAKAGAQHAGLIVDVISDMLIQPLFDPKEIDRERGVITEEINMYEDMPLQSIDEYSEELLYEPHPLGRQIIGTKEIIARLPRSAFLRYVGQQYGTKNTVACLAGNITAEEGFSLLRSALKRYPKARPQAAHPFRTSWGKRRVAVKEKKTDQAHVIVATPGVSYAHPDRVMVDLLCSILGGGMSSRLFIQVRERRGLAYSVRTSPQHFTDVGHISTQAGVDPTKLPEALAVILSEYKKIRTKAVPASELKKARESLKGRFLLRLESSEEVAQYAAGQEALTNRIVSVKEIFHQLDAVTIRDIRRAAEKYLQPQDIRIAAITPGHPEDDLRRILKTRA